MIPPDNMSAEGSNDSTHPTQKAQRDSRLTGEALSSVEGGIMSGNDSRKCYAAKSSDDRITIGCSSR